MAAPADQLLQRIASLSLSGPVAPFHVLADWLESHGEPWGRWMTLDLTAPETEAMRREKEDLEAQLLPRLAEFDLLTTWKRGFLATARVTSQLVPTALASLLEVLEQSPAAALLEELELGNCFLHDGHAPVLAHHQRYLRRLAVLDLERNGFSDAAMEALRGLFPHAKVSTLVVRG